MNINELYDVWLSEQSQLVEEKKKFEKSFVGERKYKHFDSPISLKRAHGQKIRREICNKDRIERHKFWPFVRMDKITRSFSRKSSEKLTVGHKNRHIMYASHLDAAIMSFYAWILKNNYETKIHDTVADSSVIGYRRIARSKGSKKHKSNIDFAYETYQRLLDAKNSIALCLDIKDFFGSINHRILFERVKAFEPENTEEFFAPILKAVTKYHYVFKYDIEKRLGKNQAWNDPRLYNWSVKKANIIHENNMKKGIPQGSPISDILSNIYLYDFDVWLTNKLKEYRGTFYRRYADDILLIIPKNVARKLYDEICLRFKKDFKLDIKREKTEAFEIDSATKTFKDVTKEYVPKQCNYNKNKETMQYLGFLMNLNTFAVRPGTIANKYRKEIKQIRQRSTQSNSRFRYLEIASTKSDTIHRQFHRVKRRVRKIKRNFNSRPRLKNVV